MPEFVNTGKGMQLIETNNASQVPFQQGNLIIEDSGGIYYDPTNKTDVSGRITVGKADEIIDLGYLGLWDLTDDDTPAIINTTTDAGIYKFRTKYSSGSVDSNHIMIVVSDAGYISQIWFEANGPIKYRSGAPNDLSSTAWKGMAEIDDIPDVVDNLTSSSTSAALSANQGRILDEKIDEVATDLTAHENKNATTAERGHVQLVNDLTTGGTDKALTAEQGKQLKTSLDSIELIESLGAVTSPLTSADTFKDITTPGIYNFTSGGEVGYLIVGGQNNGAQTTQYLLFDNDFYSRESTSSTSWSAWNKCLQSTDVVNNLTSGGTNVPLSAEQGKELESSKADKATTLAGYGITDAYTKTDVDTKLSSVYKYIGSVTVEQLPQNLTASDKGNVYNLTNDGTINASTEHEETVVAGDNVAWTGDYWDKLAGTIEVEPGEKIVIITSQEELNEMLADATWFDARKIYLQALLMNHSYNFSTSTVPSNVILIQGLSGIEGTLITGTITGHRYCDIINVGGTATLNNFNRVHTCEFNNASSCNVIMRCNITNSASGGVIIGCNNITQYTLNSAICIGNTVSGGTPGLYPIYNDCEVIEATGELSKLTTTAKTDLVSAINELSDNTIKIVNYNQSFISTPPVSADFAEVTTPGVYKIFFAPGERYLGQLFVSSDGDSSAGAINTGVYQVLFSHQGYIYERRITTSNPTPNWNIIGGSKKYSTIVIGNSANHTANEVDVLYDGSKDFVTNLNEAIALLPDTGGEIKLLSGEYELKTVGTSSKLIATSETKQVKVSGEGMNNTKITGGSHINLRYCELSDITINGTLYIEDNNVNIHNCRFELFGTDYILKCSQNKSIENIYIENNEIISTDDAQKAFMFNSYDIFYLYIRNNKYIMTEFIDTQILYLQPLTDGHFISDSYICNNIFGSCSIKIVANTNIDEPPVMNTIENNVIGSLDISSTTSAPYWSLYKNNIGSITTKLKPSFYCEVYSNVIYQKFVNGLDATGDHYMGNIWQDGMDKLIFANEEEIGGGQ